MTEAAAPPGRRHPIRTVIGLILLVALIVPVADVVILRFVPAPAAWLAIQRTLEGHGLQRRWRPLDQVSPNLVRAVIAAEDDKFCAHHGFDWVGIQNAMRWNARHKDRVRGGSTISQQTAKNVFLWPGRGFVRKGLEAYYTVLIETLWGKRRIMEVYLNQVEWAPGVYGAQAASQYWFKTDADRLNPAQAARLSAILPRPLKWKAVAPSPYVRRRTARISPGMSTIRVNGWADCVLKP
jgi:monofunctional biosynthetic peptidoglycan transglycosylase